MIAAQKPTNETERIASLYKYNILDTLPEREYDDITRIAADVCGMPISLISIIDNERQWFKSKVGLEPAETHRDLAFCAHAILNPDEIFVVNDTSGDQRFFDSPLVTGAPNIAFYAGVPLVNPDGNALGTLCVIDDKPNKLSREQKETLKALARQVVANFEVRLKNIQLAARQLEIEQMNEDLSRFAHAAAHDIKSPCASLAMCASYMKDNYSDVLDTEGKNFLAMMETTALSSIEMVNGILRHTQQVNISSEQKQHFTLGSIAGDLKKLITLPMEFTLEVGNPDLQLFTSKSILLQILVNLCNNAVKYNDKEKGSIVIAATDDGDHYSYSVKDNGPGIDAENQERIFDMFSTLGIRDRFNNMGTGIGLSTVKRLVQKMGGAVSIDSQMGAGSSFNFTFKK